MKRRKRIGSLLLASALTLGLAPAMAPGAAAADAATSGNAGKYINVLVGGASIGNGDNANDGDAVDPNNGYAATNLFLAFSSHADGFVIDKSESDGDAHFYPDIDGNGAEISANGGYANLTLSVADNPTLLAIAQSGQATITLNYQAYSNYISKTGYSWSQWTNTSVNLTDATWSYKNGSNNGPDNQTGTLTWDYQGGGYVNCSMSAALKPTTVLTIRVKSGGSDGNGRFAGICHAVLNVTETTAPTATYRSDTNATVNSDPGKSSELLMKLGVDPDKADEPDTRYTSDSVAQNTWSEYVDLNFDFSEPVQAERGASLSTVDTTSDAYQSALSALQAKQAAANNAKNALISAQNIVADADGQKAAAQAVVNGITALKPVADNVVNATEGSSPANAALAARAAADQYLSAEYELANTIAAAAESAAAALDATVESVQTAARSTACTQLQNAADAAASVYTTAAGYSSTIVAAADATANAASGTNTAEVLSGASNQMALYGPTTAQNNAVTAAQTNYNTAQSQLTTAYSTYNTAVAKLETVDDSALLQYGELNALRSHLLFTNTLGTGYLGSGQNRGLELYKAKDPYGGWYVTTARSYAQSGSAVPSSAALVGKRVTALSYRYSTQRGDFNGNNPIANGGGIESTAGYSYLDSNGAATSLIDKLNNAGYHDAAGNPLIITETAGSNPFSMSDGGYDVIVDAEPPTYTRVGNGITPELLTGLVLNENDEVDFTVSFSEAVMTKRGLNATVFAPAESNNTYLLFNNDDRATYVSGESSKQWVFHYTVQDQLTETEVPLWKAVALTNSALDSALATATGYSHYANADGRTITDYVGNLLADRVNLDSTTTYNPNQVESSTAWAELAVDNTLPTLQFEYEQYSNMLTTAGEGSGADGAGSVWGQASALTIRAFDADLLVPNHDPIGAGTTKPSKGIYRQENMTGDTDSSPLGLVFYIWTQSAAPPDAGTNFEAVKRYALTGATPDTVTGADYADAWTGLPTKLTMVDNFSNVKPPDAAIVAAGSGAWYLHVWTADMTWDSARQRMQYDLMSAQKYNSGYDNTKFLKTKFDAIDAYRLSYPNSHSGATIGYDDAWIAVRDSVYSTVFNANFRSWLTASGKEFYSDDAMTYANTQAMLAVGAYDDTGVWSMDKYQQPDSNWTQKTARVLFDNTAPSILMDFANQVGNDSAVVEIPFTVSDENSGINGESGSTFYQWVKASAETANPGAAFQDINWVETAVNGTAGTDLMTGYATATATATTLGNVTEDGAYYLYVKTTDMAGNTTIQVSDQTVLVNTARAALCTFGAAQEGLSPASYARTITPTATVSGIEIQSVAYAVSSSLERPADNAFTVILPADGLYTLPQLDSASTDGVWYVHLKVVEHTNNPSAQPYYFRQAYRLDNTIPALYISPDGSSLAKESVSVSVSASDALAGIPAAAIPAGETDSVYETVLYQWVSADGSETADGWSKLPASGTLTLDTAALSIGEKTGRFTLHIKAADNAGNESTKISNAFLIEAPTTVAEYGSSLLYAFQQDGKSYGIASLELKAEDKTGYRCSISPDGGKTWTSWQPYMSFLSLNLPVETLSLRAVRALDLQVKFRAPNGVVGEPAAISTGAVSLSSQPVYATATFNSLKARQSGTDVTLRLQAPEGVTVTPASGATPGADGSYTVSANGVYSFPLEQGITSTTLDVVVDLFDDTAPLGDIHYSTLLPTNANVTAALETDEAVYVTSEGGKRHIFTDNGSFVFTFMDEAGNEGSVTATVTSIDRTAPSVKILQSTSYGDQGEKTFGTLGSMRQGAALTVVKTDSAGEDFIVTSGDRTDTILATENGTYSFTVQDKTGNTNTVSVTLDNIVSSVPEPDLSYVFVDNAGMVIPGKTPGRDYANAKVKVTLSFDKDDLAVGNCLYDGISVVTGTKQLPQTDLTGSYVLDTDGKIVYTTQPISNALTTDDTGNYVLTRTYFADGETQIAVCDGLGNVRRIPITVQGIDTKAPSITLNKPVLSVSQNADTSDLVSLLGGYTATDNVGTPTVQISSLDTATTGRKTVTYTVTDGVGNTAATTQSVYVLPADGLLVTGDGVIFSAAMPESSILPTNHVTFWVDPDRMQKMGFRNGTAQNEAMRYDIYYVRGLFREGQLKYIASQITSEELAASEFEVAFDKPGWYTIIIRNQERTREYTTFFIASVAD